MNNLIENNDETRDAPVSRPRKIRDEPFGRRFNSALEATPTVPEAQHGRLTWVARELERRGVKVSVETVRRWSTGEVRPRAAPMKALAKLFGCDEAWLMLGLAPGSVTPATRRRDISMATGAAPYIIGSLRLSGYIVGIPGQDAVGMSGVDAVVTTMTGKMINIAAASAVPSDSESGEIVLRPRSTDDEVYVVAAVVEAGIINTYVIPPEVRKLAETRLGDWSEIRAKVSKSKTMKVIDASGAVVSTLNQSQNDWPEPLL